MHRDAVEANFGGDDPEIVSRSFSNAYMLVYVKKNSIGKCKIVPSLPITMSF